MLPSAHVAHVTTIDGCRACASAALHIVADFGPQHVVDFPAHPSDVRHPPVPILLLRCGTCGLVQLAHTIPEDWRYTQYWYRSGVNETMAAELLDVVEEARRWVPQISERSVVLDIGANDGTLLKAWRTTALTEQAVPFRIAMEPAHNLYDAVSRHAEKVHQACWPAPHETGYLGDRSVSVVTAIACAYGSSDLPAFLHEVERVLATDGVFVLQFQDLLSGLQTCAIDYLVHEHLMWFSVWALVQALEPHHLQVQEVQARAINAGSLRLVIQRKRAKRVPRPSVAHQVEREAAAGLVGSGHEAWALFLAQVQAVRTMIPAAVGGIVEGGGAVDLYGASTKANLLLQLCGLDSGMIRQAVERQPQKVGRYVGASGIPIVGELEFRRNPPVAALLGIYQFREAVVEREDVYLRNGGVLLVPLPSPAMVRFGKREVA